MKSKSLFFIFVTKAFPWEGSEKLFLCDITRKHSGLSRVHKVKALYNAMHSETSCINTFPSVYTS